MLRLILSGFLNHLLRIGVQKGPLFEHRSQ